MVAAKLPVASNRALSSLGRNAKASAQCAPAASSTVQSFCAIVLSHKIVEEVGQAQTGAGRLEDLADAI
jgi:hypothetical protein